MATTTTVIAISSIKVEQAEGETGKLVTGTVATVEAANELLRRIAWTGPDMGYYKTDVTVTWADGRALKSQYEIERTGAADNDTDVTRHTINLAKLIKRTATKWGQPEWAVKVADEIEAGQRSVI